MGGFAVVVVVDVVVVVVVVDDVVVVVVDVLFPQIFLLVLNLVLVLEDPPKMFVYWKSPNRLLLDRGWSLQSPLTP